MAVRDIRLIGDPILRTPTRTVTRFDDTLTQLIRDLLETVHLPGRAGVAAPQIGVDLAVFCYRLDGHLGYVVNPELIEVNGRRNGLEECLSVPSRPMDVTRHEHVVVAGANRRGDPMTIEGHGDLARCLQHETDHLAGRLYLDQLTDEGRAEPSVAAGAFPPAPSASA